MNHERIRRPLVTALKLVATLFVVAILVLTVAHAFPVLVGAEGSYVVTSGSMSPAIQTGDVIFVYETAPASLETGDIVAFDASPGDDDIVTHRIIDVVENENGMGYVTKGDANENPDPGVVRPGQVIGTVQTPFGVPARVPMLGHFLLFAGSREGIIVMVFVPVGLLIASELFTLGRALFASPTGTDEADPTPGDASATERSESVSDETTMEDD